MPARRLALLFALAAVPPLAHAPAIAHAAEVAVPAGERAQLSLTLHQDGPALVRDRRSAALEKGGSTLVLDGLPRTVRPGSAMVEGGGLTVAERWIDPGTLSAERQLAAHLGRTVSVIWDGGGAPQKARVLAAEGTPLFEADGRVVAGQPSRILYDALAPGLSPRPSFRANVEAEGAGRHDLDLTYAADGLAWTALSTGELKGDRLTLAVWADLTNTSGTDFENASLRLVAGTSQAGGGGPRLMARAMAAEAAPPLPSREAAGLFHVYTPSRPVTLRDGESRQVPLLPPAQVAVTRELVLDPAGGHLFASRVLDARDQHPVLRISFANTAAAGLGKPLPAGPVRVTARGPGGERILLGEDQLPALPEGASARLSLGQAFDVTARRVQTDFQKVSAEVTETAWEVRLANAGDHAETVTVRDAFRSEWLMLDESLPHAKEGAATARWSVPVPAHGEAVLRYRVRVK